MALELGQLWTPVGRLVQGHPITLSDKIDDKTKQVVLNPDGTPRKHLFFGLAFAKNDPAWPAFHQTLVAVAHRDWPKGEHNAPTFAWKIIDGDGYDKKAKRNADKPGFAGHWIIRITSGYACSAVAADGVRLIVDAEEIKRGYYGRAFITVKGNGPVNESPGLYLNPQLYQHVAFGEVIAGGINVADAMAAAPAIGALPPGATSMPSMPSVAATGAAPAMPTPPPPVPAVPPAPPPPVPSAPPAPPPVFPPAGWLVHPDAPGHYYCGQVVKTEAELRAMSVTPHTSI